MHTMRNDKEIRTDKGFETLQRVNSPEPPGGAHRGMTTAYYRRKTSKPVYDHIRVSEHAVQCMRWGHSLSKVTRDIEERVTAAPRAATSATAQCQGAPAGHSGATGGRASPQIPNKEGGSGTPSRAGGSMKVGDHGEHTSQV